MKKSVWGKTQLSKRKKEDGKRGLGPVGSGPEDLLRTPKEPKRETDIEIGGAPRRKRRGAAELGRPPRPKQNRATRSRSSETKGNTATARKKKAAENRVYTGPTEEDHPGVWGLSY